MNLFNQSTWSSTNLSIVTVVCMLLFEFIVGTIASYRAVYIIRHRIGAGPHSTVTHQRFGIRTAPQRQKNGYRAVYRSASYLAV